MRDKLVDLIVLILMIEGVIALTLLIAFTVWRMATGAT